MSTAVSSCSEGAADRKRELCIYIYIYLGVRDPRHVFVGIYISIYIHVYVHMEMYIRIFVCIDVYIYTY